MWQHPVIIEHLYLTDQLYIQQSIKMYALTLAYRRRLLLDW